MKSSAIPTCWWSSPKKAVRSRARFGQHSVVLMLRHGATVVGNSLKDLVLRSIFICQNADYQLRAHMLGSASPLYPGEIRQADVLHQQRAGVDRAWEYYCVRLEGKRPLAAESHAEGDAPPAAVNFSCITFREQEEAASVT